jgi:hypothetical protein
VQFPNTEFAPAFESVNVSAGVLVAVATLDANSGERFPALNVVTVPPLPQGVQRACVSPEFVSKQFTPPVGALEETARPWIEVAFPLDPPLSIVFFTLIDGGPLASTATNVNGPAVVA